MENKPLTTWEAFIRNTFKAIPNPDQTMMGKLPHTPSENKALMQLVKRMSDVSWMKRNG
jgi:hypothetical protein